VTYRKDQGRYARMLAFWALTLVLAYGCFHTGGLVQVLSRWLGSSDTVFIDPFPLLGTLKLSSLIAIGVLVVGAWAVHSVLAKPKIADTLIDTEAEMMKVTWPTWGEVWQGTVAVTSMVVMLFAFLTVVDVLLAQGMKMLLSRGGA